MAKARRPAKAKAKTKAKAKRKTRSSRPASAPAPDLGLFRVLRDDGTADPALDPDLSEDLCRRLYRQMLFLRQFDQKMLGLQRQGRIAFYGASMGQEASVVGSAACIEDDDWLYPALREGGAALLRGMALKTYIGQLYGNSADESLGHQQPMHFSWREGNHVSLSSPIGTQIPQAAGTAMAMRIRGDRRVVLGYMGDGATSEGDFHCGMNFAAVFKAPVVFICQNNGWAISVPVSMQTASETIAIKARAYGMPGVRVDGNDVLAVVSAVRDAVQRARDGDGPTFIELVTYRRLGHSSSDDPTRYRDENEVKEWERKDPLERFRKHLEARGLWDDAAEEAAIEEIGEEIQQAIREAEAAPDPPLESLVQHVYADVPEHLREQLKAVWPYFVEGQRAEGAFPL